MILNLNAFTLALLIVIVYIAVFAIVHRICNCVENCAQAKSYKYLFELSEAMQKKQREERDKRTLEAFKQMGIFDGKKKEE